MNKLSVLEKLWKSHDIPERQVYGYVNEHGMSELLARILIARGVDYDNLEHFLNPKIKSLLPNPFHMLDMEKACIRLADCIERKEKLVILGDYDVDGATSSALLKLLLEDLGCSAEIYIPDRISEGYGPTPQLMHKFKYEGYSLVITVDCGITAFDAMDEAKSLGLDVIILDHHLSDTQLPDAYAVVNPNRFDETTKYRDLAAVGVAFLFSVGLVNILRSRGYFETRQEPDLIKLLDLVALGTVCDMMILKGLNRAFVSQGLKVMQKRQNLGLRILSEYSGIDCNFNAFHLGFVIGPKINAGGRVGKASLGSSLLSSRVEDDAHQYARELERFNEERKNIEQVVFSEALELAEQQKDEPYILVCNENWHPGVVGIVAGKLKERYHKPVAVMSVENGVGKASCRSIKGLDFGGLIVDAKNNGLLLAGGGHAMAAGFTVDMAKLLELQQFFYEAIVRKKDNLESNEYSFYDAEILAYGLNLNLAREIQKLEPYGNGNAEPLLKISGLYVLKASINGRHINCIFASRKNSHKSKSIRAIAFYSVGTSLEGAIMSKDPLDLTVFGHIKVNNWQGNESVQLVVKDILIED